MKAKKWLIAGLAFILLAVILLFLPVYGKNQEFRITWLDVGQGDAILLTYANQTVLIDGGGSPTNLTGKGEYVVAPYLRSLGIDTLDYVISSHPDADHIGGLFAVLDQIRVEKLLLFPHVKEVAVQEQLLLLAENRGVPVESIFAGKTITLGDAVQIKVLAPTESEQFGEETTNEGSLVLKISYGDLAILTCGDLQGEEQMALLQKVDPAELAEIDILQMPHHGSRNSYDQRWYQAFQPEAVIISVGKYNSYGHPDGKIIDYWQKRGAKVFRTDLDGAIRITSDGKTIEYETYLGSTDSF